MSTDFELPRDGGTDGRDDVLAPVTEQASVPDAPLSRYLNQHLADIEALPTYRPRIGTIIPAYNEAESIESVLHGLLAQTRLPDEIHVIVNNTRDETFALAAPFAGPHRLNLPAVDADRYRATYPDVGGREPYLHFAEAGWRELRDPGPGRSTLGALLGVCRLRPARAPPP